MLFTSYYFLLAFLPTTVAVYAVFGRDAWRRAAILAAASMLFYAAWDWRFTGLLLGSIVVNYAIGVALQRAVAAGHRARANGLAGAGIALNLGLLAFFKYAAFAVENLNAVAGTQLAVLHVILPLGISFFTFEQVGFLIDLRRGAAYRLDLLRTAVFISFFPRLVAGPILRYNEIVPQLEAGARRRDMASDVAFGLSIFAIGLAKKAFLADGISPFVDPGFDAAAAGVQVDLLAAWGAALAYTCQLYFDFSGYSDMAIGAARCFGVRLPENFNSPYKSRDIVMFWRRWHMTLSRFLRDYLYIALGGNRRGPVRRYVNLGLTMVLGGVWHGANWTFVAWGALHGLYLMINHAWLALRGRIGMQSGGWLGALAGGGLTFLAVVVAWVFFRAPSLGAAGTMLAGMAGLHGAMLPDGISFHLAFLQPLLRALHIGTGGSGTLFAGTWAWVAVLLAIALLAPNTAQIVAAARLDRDQDFARGRWRLCAVAAGVAAFIGFLSVNRTGAFLYWQF